MMLTKERALEFKNLLIDKFPEIAKEYDAAFEKSDKLLRNIREWQYCEHLWNPFTKEDIIKMGTPETWGIAGKDSDYIIDFYNHKFGKCDKCGMPYRYLSFTDEDFDALYKQYDESERISINMSCLATGHMIENYYNDRLDDIKVG